MAMTDDEYDRWKTSPDYNPKQDYIDERVEFLSENHEYLSNKDWLWNDCVNWELVYKFLEKEVIEQIEDDKLEKQLRAQEEMMEW